MTAEYDYDLAFSFLKEDEPLAVSLADTLADRYKSFVYSKKQEELAGADGQEVFPLCSVQVPVALSSYIAMVGERHRGRA